MESTWEKGKKYVRERIYPFTFQHILYLILFTIITTYITDHFLKFRLFKWIYYGTIIVVAANLYKDGQGERAAGELFKLA